MKNKFLPLAILALAFVFPTQTFAAGQHLNYLKVTKGGEVLVHEAIVDPDVSDGTVGYYPYASYFQRTLYSGLGLSTDGTPFISWTDNRNTDTESDFPIFELYMWHGADNVGNVCEEGTEPPPVPGDSDNDGIPDSEDHVLGEPAGYNVTQQGNIVIITDENTDEVVFTSFMTCQTGNLSVIRSRGNLLKIGGMCDSEKTVYFPGIASEQTLCVQDTPSLTLRAQDSCQGNGKFLIRCPGTAYDPTDGDRVSCSVNGTTAVISPLDYSAVSSFRVSSTGTGAYRGGTPPTQKGLASRIGLSEKQIAALDKAEAEAAAKAEALKAAADKVEAGKIPFTDIGGHFAEQYINDLYNRGVQGKTAKRFGPDSISSRGDLVKMMVEAFGLEHPPVTATAFSDVLPNTTYAPYIVAAYKAGWIEGYVSPGGGAEFRPNQNVNRAEALKIIMEAVDFDLPDATVGFPDTNVNEWYSTYLSFAKRNGIIVGYTDGTFRPTNPITRGEEAVIVGKILKLLGR